jgi:hypothetical protein
MQAPEQHIAGQVSSNIDVIKIQALLCCVPEMTQGACHASFCANCSFRRQLLAGAPPRCRLFVVARHDSVLVFHDGTLAIRLRLRFRILHKPRRCVSPTPSPSRTNPLLLLTSASTSPTEPWYGMTLTTLEVRLRTQSASRVRRGESTLALLCKMGDSFFAVLAPLEFLSLRFFDRQGH